MAFLVLVHFQATFFSSFNKVRYTGSTFSFTCTTPLKNGQQQKICPRFKTFKICQHVAAVAIDLRCLKQYVAKIGGSKTQGRKNLTNLASSSKATNTGNKPKTKRKFPPSSSAAAKRKATNVAYVPPGFFPFQRVALKYVQGNIRSC